MWAPLDAVAKKFHLHMQKTDNMLTQGAHGAHPASQLSHLSAPSINNPDWRVPDTLPVCNATATRCEIWAPAVVFGMPSEAEKRHAAREYGAVRGEEGWRYDPTDTEHKPGWIVARRADPNALHTSNLILAGTKS